MDRNASALTTEAEHEYGSKISFQVSPSSPELNLVHYRRTRGSLIRAFVCQVTRLIDQSAFIRSLYRLIRRLVRPHIPERLLKVRP